MRRRLACGWMHSSSISRWILGHQDLSLPCSRWMVRESSKSHASRKLGLQLRTGKFSRAPICFRMILGLSTRIVWPFNQLRGSWRLDWGDVPSMHDFCSIVLEKYKSSLIVTDLRLRPTHLKPNTKVERCPRASAMLLILPLNNLT